MRSHLFVAAAAFGFLAGGLSPTVGTAQLFRGQPRSEPAWGNPAPAPVNPLPGVTDPARPPSVPPSRPDVGHRHAGQSHQSGQAGTLHAEGETRILRGSQFIGLRVRGPDNQQLGTIKDFVVDYQGDCPALFFAMAPAVADFGEGYVIVPFTAMMVAFDTRANTHYFRFHVNSAQLRNAPHIEVNRWNSFSNRQFLVNTQQFYQRIERTSARPESGGRVGLGTGREPGVREEPDIRRDQGARPETGTRPNLGDRPDSDIRRDTNKTPDGQNRPDAGSRPDLGKRPEAESRPETGSRPDADRTPDGGSRPDAGNRPDTGRTPDAGHRPDTGNRPDAGSPSRSGGAGDQSQPQSPTRR